MCALCPGAVCTGQHKIKFALVHRTVYIGEHKIKFAQVHTRAIGEMAEAAAALHLPCQINHVQPTSDDEDGHDDHSLCLCLSQMHESSCTTC